MKSEASGAEWVGFCGPYDGRGGAYAVGEGESWESGAGEGECKPESQTPTGRCWTVDGEVERWPQDGTAEGKRTGSSREEVVGGSPCSPSGLGERGREGGAEEGGMQGP